MRVLALACAVGLTVTTVVIAAEMKGAAPEWKMNATVIEACSCPMFCTCYFGSGHPASTHDMSMMSTSSHAEEHFCRFNNAYKVNKGTYKGVKLDGAKFWVSGDLGGDFTQGKMDWAVVTFDRATSQAQRDGMVSIIGALFTVKWNSITTGVGYIAWTATKD